MDSLRTAVSALAFYDAGARDLSREGALRTATKLTAQLEAMVQTEVQAGHVVVPVPLSRP